MTNSKASTGEEVRSMPVTEVVETPGHPFVARIHVLAKDISRGAPIGRPYLSPSRINAYQRCEAQYYYKYVLGLKEPKNSSLLFGTKAHDAQEHVLNAVVEARAKEQSVDENEIEKSAIEVGTKYEVPEDIIWKETYKGSKTPEDPESLQRSITGAIRLMVPYWLKRKVVQVEQGYLIDWKDEDVLPLLGYYDYVESEDDGTESIVDLKTGASKTEMDLRLNIAMPLYATMRSLSANTIVSNIRYDSLVRNKVPIRKDVVIPVDPRDERRAFNRAKDVTARIKTGTFLPADNAMVCNGCAFFNRCREEFSQPPPTTSDIQNWQIVDEVEE